MQERAGKVPGMSTNHSFWNLSVDDPNAPLLLQGARYARIMVISPQNVDF